ncbi:Bug family tripartite tricarboxylate transporter substrate binding protein [Variovorax sp. RA8]|uniref:Bug family tripartite tricarboxylate transporter substrate binding protein n=1 Tax=Variovorax sp. (strain JCM 16519 / RA8) TaxID=662548 RepID=UPI0013A59582|nr:tripartite tricarboxylate transporter substrate binding protein [Variovorax sp. RA8]
MLATRVVAQADYPTRPIKLIIFLPPGSMTDTLMRTLAPEVQKILGQPLIIDNKPGASGLIAFQAVKAAAPDGYTLGVLTPSTWRDSPGAKLPYDPLRDFTYICNLSETAFAITVAADSPFKTWKDLIEYGKKDQDKTSYGAAPGLGQSPHLFIEEIARTEKVRWTPIPYKGANESTTALIGGQIAFSIDPLLATSSLVRAGKLRYIAMARAEPVKNWPDVPTMKQLGYHIVVDSPLGIGGPAGLPGNVIARLSSAFKTVLEAPSIIEMLDRADQPRRFMEAAAYRQLVQRNMEEQRVLAERYGTKPNS